MLQQDKDIVRTLKEAIVHRRLTGDISADRGLQQCYENGLLLAGSDKQDDAVYFFPTKINNR